MSYKYYLIGCLVMCLGQLQAQQNALFADYTKNHSFNNPASIDEGEALFDFQKLFGIFYKHQWGAMPRHHRPTTIGAYFDVLPDEHPISYGVNIIGDKNGPINIIDLKFRFAYHARLFKGHQHYLSLGLSFGGFFYDLNINQLQLRQPGDIVVETANTEVKGQLNAGLGIFYYWKRKFYVGIGIPNVMGQTILFQETAQNTFQIQQFEPLHLTLGGYISLNQRDYIELSTQVKHILNAAMPDLYNARINYNWKNIFRAGISYTHLGKNQFNDLYLGHWSAEFGYRNNTYYYGIAFPFLIMDNQLESSFGMSLEVNFRYSIQNE